MKNPINAFFPDFPILSYVRPDFFMIECLMRIYTYMHLISSSN